MEAFEKEMSMFDAYQVKTPVRKQDVPRGARVTNPVVVFTKKLRLNGRREMKCRVTCNGSKLRMEDCETANVDWREARLLIHMAAAHQEFRGSIQTADAEQGYLQADAQEGPVYMVPPDMHPDKRAGYLWRLNKNLYG